MESNKQHLYGGSAASKPTCDVKAPESGETHHESSKQEGLVRTPMSPVAHTEQEARPDFHALVQSLPGEMQCKILEHRIRETWASSITRQEYYAAFVERGPGHPTRYTDRAMLAHLTVRFRDPGCPVETHPVGWVVIPLYTGRGIEATTASVKRGTVDLENETRRAARRARRDHWTRSLGNACARRAWDALRLSRILEDMAYSTSHYRHLRAFLFRHLTWVFRHPTDIQHMMNGSSPRLPPDFRGNLRSVCLEIGDGQCDTMVAGTSWAEFTFSLGHLVGLLSRPDSPVSGVTSLELNGQWFDAKVINRWTQRVIDETIRTRYMVTQCFELVKRRPNIKIILSGGSFNTATKIHPDVEARDEYGHRASRSGLLGYSDADVVRFRETSHETRLPSLEVVMDGNSIPGMHWKLLFVEEWKSIWKLGLRDEENTEGYPGVHDAHLTYIVDTSDVDSNMSDVALDESWMDWAGDGDLDVEASESSGDDEFSSGDDEFM